jgi:hypothetical protein
MAGGQIVEYCDIVAPFEQQLDHVRADVAGSPAYEYVHGDSQSKKDAGL